MPRFQLLGAVLLLSHSTLDVEAQSEKPPRTIAGEVSGHRLTSNGALIAHDLDHGIGAARLRMTRLWLGRETLDSHFGPGWSDENEVRLGLIDADAVIIWRGGVGWYTAYRKGEQLFAGASGETIRRTDSGWTAEQANGGALVFDNDGRLTADRPAVGPARNYTYDNNGRLSTIGTAPENLLRYQYDAKAKRVLRVDGPEGPGR